MNIRRLGGWWGLFSNITIIILILVCVGCITEFTISRNVFTRVLIYRLFWTFYSAVNGYSMVFYRQECTGYSSLNKRSFNVLSRSVVVCLSAMQVVPCVHMAGDDLEIRARCTQYRLDPCVWIRKNKESELCTALEQGIPCSRSLFLTVAKSSRNTSFLDQKCQTSELGHIAPATVLCSDRHRSTWQVAPFTRGIFAEFAKFAAITHTFEGSLG